MRGGRRAAEVSSCGGDNTRGRQADGWFDDIIRVFLVVDKRKKNRKQTRELPPAQTAVKKTASFSSRLVSGGRQDRRPRQLLAQPVRLEPGTPAPGRNASVPLPKTQRLPVGARPPAAPRRGRTRNRNHARGARASCPSAFGPRHRPPHPKRARGARRSPHGSAPAATASSRARSVAGSNRTEPPGASASHPILTRARAVSPSRPWPCSRGSDALRQIFLFACLDQNRSGFVRSCSCCHSTAGKIYEPLAGSGVSSGRGFLSADGSTHRAGAVLRHQKNQLENVLTCDAMACPAGCCDRLTNGALMWPTRILHPS